MHRITSRKHLTELPELPLPFYVRSVGYNEADPGWREVFPGNMKNFVQLFWTIRGEGEFILADRTIRSGPGDIFYRLPGEKHAEHNCGSSEWCYFWVTFDGPGAAAFMESFGYGRDGLHAGDCPVPLFLELEHRIRQEDATALRKMLSLCVEILTLAGGNGIQPQEQDLFERAMQLIRENYTDPSMNVDYLIKQLGIHRSTLNRLFAAKGKCSPGDLIRSLRMEHALELLRTTTMPVKEAAYASGFNDPAYFCRRIRKATGMTPEEIRKKKQKKASKSLFDSCFFTR